MVIARCDFSGSLHESIERYKKMKSSDPLHNPFYNRFNDPVRRRQDDLQAHAYSLWLKEQNRILPPRDRSVPATSEQKPMSTRIAGALALVVVLLISAGVLFKAL
jgi:hypothetical protein